MPHPHLLSARTTSTEKSVIALSRKNAPMCFLRRDGAPFKGGVGSSDTLAQHAAARKRPEYWQQSAKGPQPLK